MPRYQSGIALDPSGLSPDLREDISHSFLNSILSACLMSVGSSSGARELLTRLDTDNICRTSLEIFDIR